MVRSNSYPVNRNYADYNATNLKSVPWYGSGMLSQNAKYALRAALMLAERFGAEAPVAVSEIAERERIPQKFLEAILVELRDSGILLSRRGRAGGYSLQRPPEAISF